MDKWIGITAGVLVVAGAVNWGLGIFDVNIVESLAGTGTVAKAIYGAIGISGLVVAPKLLK